MIVSQPKHTTIDFDVASSPAHNTTKLQDIIPGKVFRFSRTINGQTEIYSLAEKPYRTNESEVRNNTNSVVGKLVAEDEFVVLEKFVEVDGARTLINIRVMVYDRNLPTIGWIFVIVGTVNERLINSFSFWQEIPLSTP